MRFSEVWLREWVDPPIDTDALVDQLSMSGLEVDAVEPAAPAFSGVCIGRVDSVESHPDASKLRVCTVDVGGEEALQIVCGAANVAVGMRVPVATLGARLPGGLAIKRVRLRGVESFGMICSAAELGLAESSDGILALPGSAPLGEDLRAFLQLDDRCIELDLTPDRGDCLSLAGVAREVGVLNRVAVGGPVPAPVPAEIDDRFPIDLRAEAACPRYLCRVVRGIDPSAETPLWMRERLRRSGLRPISAVVDVTNYVLLELGQPMHAFDLARLDEGIEVRMARPAEPLVLLNGESLALREDTLVIADRSRAVALAGIMGGAETAVSEQTRDILLESAFFSPAEISGKARSYGLHTDSSHRFERGVDPGIQALAIERATALLGEIVGGSPGPVVEVTSEAHLPRPQPLLLRRDRLPRVLGIEMHDERVVEILSRLGMAVENHPEGWRVTPPSSRFDLLLEVDLIAEIGRVHGYDRIPATHARSAATTSAPPEMAFELERVCRLLVDRGYHEAITYSFVGPEYQAMIDPATPPLALANPLSAELSVMRTTLWPGLLQAAGQNLARQQSRVRLFESGLRFLPQEHELKQEEMLAGLCVGPVAPEQWGERGRSADFFDIKADVEAVLAASGCAEQCRFVAPDEDRSHPALHPGQSALVERDGEEIGWVGTLSPSLAARLELPTDLQLFELRTAALGGAPTPSFRAPSKFPSIRRDLAVVVDDSIPFETLRRSVEAAAGGLLRNLVLFDVYAGANVESGRKSMALGLILQADSQTLTDQDVEALVGRVVERLKRDLGATLRS